MKTRKGFTLVELVIVIAVIAILAGVLIGTFASVINRANDSARLQELKAQEIEQKADDILQKIEDSGWYGWEDFETSIVAKMTQVYKDSEQATDKENLTEAQIKRAVTLAIEDYAKANANSKTNLTEDQVRAIVENAVGEINYSGVTEPQVKAIIDSAQNVVKSSDIPASTVKEIVDAANANNLTAPDVTKIITINIGGASSSDFDTKLNDAVAAIKAGQRSDADLTALISTLVPITKHVATVADFEAAITNLQSGSTIYLDENFVEPTEGLAFTLTTGDMVKTFTLRGKDIAKLTVNAPDATLYVMNNVTTLVVEAIANNSIHTYGTVETATVKSGRYVVERKSVGTLTAAPGKVGDTVAIEIGAFTSVNQLVAQYQKHGTGTNNYIQISNAGHVGGAQLTGSDGWNYSNNTTNVRLFLKAGSTGLSTTVAGAAAGQTITTALNGVQFIVVDEATDVTKQVSTPTEGAVTYTDDKSVPSFWGEMYATSFAGGDGSPESPYQISNATELARLSYLILSDSATNYNSKSYVLTADIDLSGRTWMPISSFGRDTYNAKNNNAATGSKWFAGTFDGQGYTINGLSDNNIGYIVHTYFTGTNSSSVGEEYTFGLFGSVKNATFRNIKFTNVSIKGTMFNPSTKDVVTTVTKDNTILADSSAALVGYSDGSLTVDNVVVESGSIQASDGVGGIVGRAYNRYQAYSTTDDVKVISITNCTNNATVKGFNDAVWQAENSSTHVMETKYGYSHVAGILGFTSDNTRTINNKSTTVATYVIENNTNNGYVYAENSGDSYIDGICYGPANNSTYTANNTDNAHIVHVGK